jgi:hypothetical protein
LKRGFEVATVQERREKRKDYLVALYELSEGNPMAWQSEHDIAAYAHLSANEALSIGQTHVSDNLIEYKTMGPTVSITAAGIARAEQIILEREGGGQPRISSAVLLTDQQVREALEPLLERLRRGLDDDADLPPETRADVQSDIDSANDQLRATHPNRGIVRSALERVKSLWPWVVGVAEVFTAVEEILHGLGR